MFSLKPKTRFPRGLLMAAGALLLAGCEGDVSDDIAQEGSVEISLQQCEVALSGVVGTPTDPVTINGEPTQACLLDTDAGQRGDVRLKSSHNFKPLVWVLDGTYEIGQSKRYATLADWKADAVHSLKGDFYTREGALVVVHRNGNLGGTIQSEDDNNTGTGEWAGVVVNGVGPHPDCGSNASADNFCNIEGPWGLYGGVSPEEGVEFPPALADSNQVSGFNGWAIEAGGEPASGAAPAAAITLNAPHPGQNRVNSRAAYSAKTGLEINGGALGVSLAAMGNEGSAVHWHSGFSGRIAGVAYHEGEAPALRGESGDSVTIQNLTLVDKNLQAASAIQLGGGGETIVDNVVIQGFSACLQVEDAITKLASIGNSVFNCASASAASADGSDYATAALESAENLYTGDPALDPRLQIGNSLIEGVDARPPRLPGAPYDFSLLYPACFGVGTLLEETVQIGRDTYGICQLGGEIEESFAFKGSINGEPVAWRLEGDLTLGADFSGLDAAAQKALLEAPAEISMNGDSRILMGENASITVTPGAALRIAGTASDPVELRAEEDGKTWRGLTIEGLADSCGSEALCQLAREQFVDIRYLRLLNTGAGGAAFTLNGVSEAGRISHLDIADAAGDALALNGGAVNIDHLLVADTAGNGVQWRNGYRGTLQYAILQSGDNSQGHALHGRNSAEDHNATPRSRPVMANITARGAENADTAILLEQGTGLLLYNAVVADFNTCLDIDHQATADLQYTDPQQIHFDNVILDCGAEGERTTLPLEDEDGGFDFAVATLGQAGVYEVDAVLDSNFVPSGSDIPAIESEIDLTLAGGSAGHLDAAVGYMGSVRDSQDDWYLGWSDSVGVLLAEECDYLGVLEEDYISYNSRLVYDEDGDSADRVDEPRSIVCGLRGTITEDLLLSGYTGDDRRAMENGEGVVRRAEFTYRKWIDGESVEVTRELEYTREPVSTIWLLNGLVRIGEGHLEITDPAQAAAMKADPVTLGIAASATVASATPGSGLHITRGGALEVVGGVDLAITSGDLYNRVTFRPMLSDTSWRGLIVDGFGRNNQCPEAMAEPGSRVCNIRGEFGYYGGYDNEHGNLQVENLFMQGGIVQLNSVGGGSEIYNMHFDGSWEEMAPEDYGRPAIDIDGGAVKMRNLRIPDPEPSWSNLIRWNHGYQGSLQSLSLRWSNEQDDGDDIPGYDMVFPGGDGNTYFHSAIYGSNGGAGHENDLPRSMPTIANLNLDGTEVDPHDFDDARSVWVELAGGSGLFLHNSMMGGHNGYYEKELTDPNPHTPGYGEIIDYCFKVDAASASLLGSEIVFNQLATDCTELSTSVAFENSLKEHFGVREITNSSGNIANTGTLPATSLATSDIYRLNWVRSKDTSDTDFDNDWPAIAETTYKDWGSIFYPAADVINLGRAQSDYSTSKTADPEFLQSTDYMGYLDYFIPIEAAGFDIVDD